MSPRVNVGDAELEEPFELVVDALHVAIWNRRPEPEAIRHSDHGSTYTIWSFGQRLRKAGPLCSMGSIGDCFDNSVVESFFATLQTELLDRSHWPTRDGLGQARLRLHRGLRQPAPAALHTRLRAQRSCQVLVTAPATWVLMRSSA